MEAGLPPTAWSTSSPGYGSEAGAALAAHPGVDKISFTGSTETGRKIVEASAGNLKRLQLELGGKSPDIVFADADLDIAVPGAAMGVYANSGQICLAGTRLFVQRSVQDEFVERLEAVQRDAARSATRSTPEVDLGPLISQKQLDRVMRLRRDRRRGRRAGLRPAASVWAASSPTATSSSRPSSPTSTTR